MTTTTLVRPVERRPDTLRGRLAERRLLARRNRLLAWQDRLAARLLELRDIAELTGRAAAVIEAGWIQRGWYRYAPEDERRKTVRRRTER